MWLLWASAFLIPWTLLYAFADADRRRVIWRTSLITSLFGLTEPIFVPQYWNPPSLFDLAARTGFDIESLIFSFAIGGIGASAYAWLTRESLGAVLMSASTVIVAINAQFLKRVRL